MHPPWDRLRGSSADREARSTCTSLGIRWRKQIDAAAEQARRGFGSTGYFGGDNFRLRPVGS
jgi:hypothetical protein